MCARTKDELKEVCLSTKINSYEMEIVHKRCIDVWRGFDQAKDSTCLQKMVTNSQLDDSTVKSRLQHVDTKLTAHRDISLSIESGTAHSSSMHHRLTQLCTMLSQGQEQVKCRIELGPGSHCSNTESRPSMLHQ